jgi:uncharacterized protein YbjQ (UPF0145 family)
MDDSCNNCYAEISDGGFIKSPNFRYKQADVELVNLKNDSNYTELCHKCGKELVRSAISTTDSEIAEKYNYIQSNIIDFPMITIGCLPTSAKYKIKSMITANVTVGTGLFSEFSQSISDVFGATNTNSGMAYKINSGEMTARSILAFKALEMGANCVIAVDVDYGTTANNAATINMQGTPIVISNLSEIFDEPEILKSSEIEKVFQEIISLQSLLKLCSRDAWS